MNIQEAFEQACKKPDKNADIWEHVERLSLWASKVGHITEFGVRSGNSTIAFMHGLARNGGELLSYDIRMHSVPAVCPENVKWVFATRDTAEENFQIPPTDLLFIDSNHEYQHVAKEIKQERYVRRFIIMHDVSPMWEGGYGPLRAMTEFLDTHRNWHLLEFHHNCNGLAIMERLH